MTHSLGRDLEGSLYALSAAAITVVTAGGGADAVAQTGLTINRASLANDFQSLAFAVALDAALASSETAIVTAKIEDSADGSSWADLVASETIATVTDATNGENGAGQIGVDLTTARQYVRIEITVTMSAGLTDTCTFAALALFAGARDLPIVETYQPS